MFWEGGAAIGGVWNVGGWGDEALEACVGLICWGVLSSVHFIAVSLGACGESKGCAKFRSLGEGDQTAVKI